METYLHLWLYLAEFFLEWEMLMVKFLEKINHAYYDQCFSENLSLYEIMWKNMVALDSKQLAM